MSHNTRDNVAMIEDIEVNNTSVSVVNDIAAATTKEGRPPMATRKRRQTSEAWNHFKRLPLSETKGKHRARCNYCGQDYASHPSNHGTKQLLRHFQKCPKNPNKATKSQSLFSVNSSQTVTHHVYNEEQCRKSIAKFIIKDEMPFRVVEGEGFREMLQDFEPRFKVPSRWTIARDCYQLYLEEAKNLKKYFKKSQARVSLTTDCWTSIQNMNYMCLTAHWIDDEWILQKRILNFCVIEDHKGDTIGKEIETCLLNWGIDKVFTITVDNASANNTAVAYLRKRLKSWNGLVLDGEFMHMRCAAHILNLIVSEGLKDMNRSIELIRHAIKFVKSSPSRLNRFKELVLKERIDSKSLLCYDCPTRWNSTYLMLESAVKFIKVFNRMEEEDVDYKDYFKRKVRFNSSNHILQDDLNDDDERDDAIGTTQPPSEYDWSVAKEFLEFLKLFYLMTLKFSGSNYVTTNTCFIHIVAIQSSLHKSANSEYSLLTGMAKRMQSKFDKYWGDMDKMNPLLVIAVILDPRYKVTYVEIAFEKIFPDPVKREATLKDVIDVLYRLYDQYAVNVHPSNDALRSQALKQMDDSGGDKHNESNPEDGFEDVSLSAIDPTFQKFLATANIVSKKPEQVSEVDEYLKSDLIEFDEKFDPLAWWKVHACKFKVLNLIARDLLAAPVSTVSSESAFSTGGRILDAFRSSLSSNMAEALICAQNWLRTSHPSKVIDLDVDNVEESANVVTEQDSTIPAPNLNVASESEDEDASDDSIN